MLKAVRETPSCFHPSYHFPDSERRSVTIFRCLLLLPGSVVLAPVLYPLQLLLAASRWMDPMVFTILAPIPGFYTLHLLARLVCRAAGRPSC